MTATAPLGGGRFGLATGAMPAPAVVAAAGEAERAGAEVVLIGETAAEADALVTAAAVLGATVRVRAGSGVVDAASRHPTVLARAAASLDRLAPGRAVLGVGRGDPGGVATLAGGAVSLGDLEDLLRIVAALLHGERVTRRGRRWSVAGAQLSAQARPVAAVPLVLAAVGQRTLRLAGALADGVLLNYAASLDYVGWAVAEVAEGARAAGRDPATVDVYGHLLAVRTGVPGADRRLARMRATVGALLATPGQGDVLSRFAPRDAAATGLGAVAMVGDSPAALAERVGAYRDAGLRCPLLLPSGLRALGLIGAGGPEGDGL